LNADMNKADLQFLDITSNRSFRTGSIDVVQECSSYCSSVTLIHEWSPSSPELNTLEYHMSGAMPQK